MPKGRWTITHDHLADEAYAVLIERRKPTRTLSRVELRANLIDPSVYSPFLKHCLDYDDSVDLKRFRQGLLLTVQARGVSEIARLCGVSRVSLYRMLTGGGNPRFKSLLGLLRALQLRFWLVDEEFVRRRTRVTRPKDVEKFFSFKPTDGRVKSKRRPI